MKVITYNLHKGRGPRNRDILADVIAAIEARAPDLLVCQEVHHGLSDELHQSRVITAALGHAHVFGPNVFKRAGCHGNATFTRLTVSRYVNVNITESLLERRGMLRTWLLADSGPLELLNVHFSLTGRQRHRQWLRLLASLPDDPQVPVLACGDFNDWRGVLDRHALRSGLLQNAMWSLPKRERLTFPARRPLLALDRIYFRNLRLVGVRVLSGHPWDELSDHLPVEAEFAAGEPES